MGQELNSSVTEWSWSNDGHDTITFGAKPVVLQPRKRLHQPKLRQGVRSPEASDIPFEPQRQIDGQRTCGAAALAMTLRGLGVPCTQEELWDEIACLDGAGHWAARTFHLASAALRRAMPALVIQAREGWNTLERLAADVPGLILNHRIENNSPQGHYSVLVDIDHEAALLHDPLFGPRRIVSRAQLESLWQPLRKHRDENEIAGNVLVGFGPRVAQNSRCRQCDLRFPAYITCGNCAQHFALQPATVLGCMRSSCGECRWQKLFCPFCDAVFQPVE